MTVLQKFELLREGRITRAAFLLFMAGESSLTAIELGRFQTPTIIKDGARLKADLFAEVDGVMAFIRKHISKAYIIRGEPQRASGAYGKALPTMDCRNRGSRKSAEGFE